MRLSTQKIEDLQEIRGISFPADIEYRQLLFVGPPGSGKSTLVRRLKGWPTEGYLDLARPWWRDAQLTYRPREAHLGFPIAGQDESMTLFEERWPGAVVDPARIQLPPTRRWFFRADWRRRLAFDVQLLPAETLFEIRRERARCGSHPVDANLSLEQVRAQVAAYEALALLLQRSGLRVHVRTRFEGPPLRVIVQRTSPPASSS